MNARQLYIGCAGWKLGREYGEGFQAQGTHLERYASRLTAVEINSSFYRPHRPSTYAKWAAAVGPAFRFSVKMPKSITHENRLQNCSPLLDTFLAECTALNSTLGCLLVQLPPSLQFDARIAGDFLEALRARYSGQVVIEPRHESWVSAQAMLVDLQIAQAAVDPGRLSGDEAPSGWPGFRYWRLHGSPRIYYSAYETDWLEQLARKMEATMADGVPTWCIFDNTARDAALGNALFMQTLLT
ncbi:DUF72 domain-containing protein [Pseudomonas bohemica]|uniref:DUF72 domain-containing protein n=1 Tax=Pseudomonas bohemica TaxID=2044872 RepID=UPI001F36BD54|nr:DUF72 domain-containing protein [Pseudomonas bohemica]